MSNSRKEFKRRNWKESWSNFWIPEGMTTKLSLEVTPEKKLTTTSSFIYASYLAKVMRGISNFVRILTGKNIPVSYASSGLSRTDNKEIIIALPSSSTNGEEIDAMTGLAMHEASHIKYSQDVFIFLENFTGYTLVTLARTLGYELEITAPLHVGKSPEQLLFHYILNILEDRKIDALTYREAPGYRPYYDAMYDELWTGSQLDEKFSDPMYYIPTRRNYLFHLISIVHPKFNKNALPHLAEIMDIVNLPHITRYAYDNRWNDMKSGVLNGDEIPLIIQDTIKIMKIIMENEVTLNSPSTPDSSKSNSPSMPGMPGGESSESNSQSKEENDSSKTDSTESSESEREPSDTKAPSSWDVSDIDNASNMKEIEKLLQFTNGDFSKADNGIVSRELEKMISFSRPDNVEIRDTSIFDESYPGKSFNIPCMVVKRVTMEYLDIAHNGVGSAAFTDSDSQVAVERGIRLGRILANRLKVLSDESTFKSPRQVSGKLDKRLTYSLGYDNENIFFKQHVEKLDPVFLDISIDASSSMRGEKWINALAIAVALAWCSKVLKNLHVRINVRGTTEYIYAFESSGGQDHRTGDIPLVAYIFDSRIDTFDKVRQIFPHLYPLSYTPEGLCYAAIEKENLNVKKNFRYFFLNLSDGAPYMTVIHPVTGYSHTYTGDSAVIQTAREVKKIAYSGSRVLAYFMTDTSYLSTDREELEENFRKMYGPSAQFIDVENATDILRTLNRLFLSSGD